MDCSFAYYNRINVLGIGVQISVDPAIFIPVWFVSFTGFQPNCVMQFYISSRVSGLSDFFLCLNSALEYTFVAPFLAG